MAIRAKLDPQNHFIMGLEARKNQPCGFPRGFPKKFPESFPKVSRNALLIAFPTCGPGNLSGNPLSQIVAQEAFRETRFPKLWLRKPFGKPAFPNCGSGSLSGNCRSIRLSRTFRATWTIWPLILDGQSDFSGLSVPRGRFGQ
jgi:hypothetical protein